MFKYFFRLVFECLLYHYFFGLTQIKRSKGLKLFDLDKTVSDAVTSTLRYQLTSDGFVPIEVKIESF